MQKPVIQKETVVQCGDAPLASLGTKRPQTAVIRFDIKQCKELFRALLETLPPEQLTKVSHYLQK